MIESLTVRQQRLAAAAILLIAVALILIALVLPLVNGAVTSVAELQDARHDRDQLTAIVDAPRQPRGDPVPAGAFISTARSTMAADMLVAHLRALAGQTGLSIDVQSPMRPPGTRPGIIAVDFVASGQELQVIAFLNALERGQPVVRLPRWQIAAPDDPQGQHHLTARAFAAFGRR